MFNIASGINDDNVVTFEVMRENPATMMLGLLFPYFKIFMTEAMLRGTNCA